MHDEASERWPADKKLALVLRILKGEISAQQAADQYHLSLDLVEDWEQRFLAAAQEARTPSSRDERSEIGISSTASSREIGIWICGPSGQPLTPCLFIEAACKGSLPSEMSIRWSRASTPPRPFARTGLVTLLHGECRQSLPGDNRLSFFTTRMVDTASFEGGSKLSDWRLPVHIAGIVLFLDERDEHALVRWFLGIARGTRTLRWVEAQQLPVVIAAMGYDIRGSSEEHIRRRYHLSAQIPIVAGPSLAPVHQSRASSQDLTVERDVISFLLMRRNLAFDTAFAARIIETVNEVMAG